MYVNLEDFFFFKLLSRLLLKYALYLVNYLTFNTNNNKYITIEFRSLGFVIFICRCTVSILAILFMCNYAFISFMCHHHFCVNLRPLHSWQSIIFDSISKHYLQFVFTFYYKKHNIIQIFLFKRYDDVWNEILFRTEH